MKILVTGAAGQVGWELARELPALGEVVAMGLEGMDLARPDEIRRVLRELRPDVVVNAAAYTAVDKAESEPELARLVNAVAPGVMAEELRTSGGLLIHYSTDYVFDGAKTGPYSEDDEPNPLSSYGASKLEGERAIQAVGVSHLILRTSWVYGARGRNFLLTMLRLFQERDELKIVDDQIGAPTWSRWISQTTASVLKQCIESRKSGTWVDAEWSGIYHVTAGGSTSWFGFAEAIRALSDAAGSASKPRLVPITSAEYPLLAKRPGNSILSNAKIAARCGVVQSPWGALLRECIAELRASPAGHGGGP
jgi:dTDP-4-dehydrorhamnose reductase